MAEIDPNKCTFGELHQAIDSDDSGYIEKDEFEASMSGENFEQWDVNGDGKISEKELAQGMMRQWGSQRLESKLTADYFSSKVKENARQNSAENAYQKFSEIT